MPLRRCRGLSSAALCLTSFTILGAPSAGAQAAPQTQADDYTRYELLAPGSAKFRILYEVTATTPGAHAFFNPIRKGSVASNESVIDRFSGAPLKFEVVNGAIAHNAGVRGADSSGEYIMVHLARPVPADGGQARILIDKTYEDAKSYFVAGDTIVFNRPLGIKRNAVVLPRGFELLSVNYPSQVKTETDGRIAVSFWNVSPAEAPYIVKARCATPRMSPSACPALAPLATAKRRAPDASTPGNAPSREARLDERAHQNRDIVYFLRPPETHTFDLYHDYTESKAGVSTYINVVRPGSKVEKPSAKILDTGDSLSYEVLNGAQITAKHLDIGEPVTPKTSIVVFHFPEVKQGESLRLRMSETYSDSVRYRLDGDELVWDRSFGRPHNAMVLPAGWMLANCSIPTSVSMTNDGRVRLDFLNPRTDQIDVFVTARRRPNAN